jgi:hypothetical protein
MRGMNKESSMASSTAAALHSEGSAVGWGFWLKWFLACLAGFVVGIPLFIGLSLLFGDQPSSVVMENAVNGVIHGAEFGIAQWLILRRQVPKVGWWVAASIVGFAIGFPLAKTLFGALSTGLLVAGSAGAVVGAIVGIPQWWVLRGRVTGAGWWVLASVVAWMLSAILGQLGAMAAGEDFVADLLRVILGAALTGAGMVWLLRQTVPSTRTDAAEMAQPDGAQA